MGTLFSLNSILNYVGKTIAPAIGGALLIVSSGMYGLIGLVLGGMTLIGCLIILLLVKGRERHEEPAFDAEKRSLL
jgi:hypothetical protein